MPSITSGKPICVCGSSEAMRESHASASSVPPPRHTPSIAASVGARSAAIRWNAACARRTIDTTCAGSVIPAITFTSAPATNEPGFPLRSTTPRSSDACSSSPRATSRSAIAPS